MNNIVNMMQLSIILNTGTKTLSPYLIKHEKKDNNSYKIDIDKFLNKVKIYNFKFINEQKNKSFIDRMIVTKDINKYSEKLKTKDIVKILGYSPGKIKYLRDHRKLKYKVIDVPNYPINSKPRKQYLYFKSSLIDYINKNEIKISINEIEYKKQFFSTKEAIKYIEKHYNLYIPYKTFYRYIVNYNKIPAIKIEGIIRIPIKEFMQLPINQIFLKQR